MHCQSKISEREADAALRSGVMTRNRLPSAETPQSAAMPGAWNNVAGEPTSSTERTLTETETIASSGVMKKSSLPSALHRGALPPD